ncbi:MAG: alpha/beta fold hydrolase, partial [Bacteroidia bacterium]
MKHIFYLLSVILILFLSPCPGFSQEARFNPEGTWLGNLNVGAVNLRIVFNITIAPDGTISATMDSPDQGANGIPMGEVTLWNDSIKIDAPLVRGFYLGKSETPSKISGIWNQGGQKFDLNLEHQVEAFMLNRPQEPKPPFPYKAEDVTFENAEAGFTLGGTVTRPEGEGPYPAVILVSGSGQQNRNEELFGHKPFLYLADQLTRKGIAVLRYDDRGVGQSGGDPRGGTSADFAEDAKAALDWLVSMPYTDKNATGIIGHSEGGLIALILASENPDI